MFKNLQTPELVDEYFWNLGIFQNIAKKSIENTGLGIHMGSLFLLERLPNI